MMIISIREDLFPSRYKDVDKLKPQWKFFFRQGSCLISYFEDELRKSWTRTYLNMDFFQLVISKTILPKQVWRDMGQKLYDLK